MNKKEPKEPLVSILMGAYNVEKYIIDVIESAIAQTHKNFEFLILDDYSTDKTAEIIKKYSKKDKRIKYYKNKENLGKPKTYTKLMTLMSSESKYFFLMGADDVMTPTLIEKKRKYLDKHKELSGLGSSIDYVDENLKFIKKRKYPKKYEDILKQFLNFSPFAHPGMMLRNALKSEPYNSDYKVCQDYELWCRLISKGHKFENLDETFILYRQQKNQGKQKNLKMTIRNTLRIKSKYLFKIKYFNFPAFIRFILEAGLLILPKRFILWLFYKMK